MRARISTPEVNRHFTPSIPYLDLRPGLAAVRCPLLVLAGEQDPLVPPSSAEEAVQAIPNGLATLHRIPNAGHQVLWDTPDVVDDLLRPFVERCAGRADRKHDAPGTEAASSVHPWNPRSRRLTTTA